MLVLNYILDAILATLFQLLILFGPFLMLAVIMHNISSLIERFSIRFLGLRGYLFSFGWLGTSVHELGHAILCPVFGHKITEMKLFSVDYETGTLGYVNHDFNPRNPYHIIGNFFIGVGPIILGSTVLYGIIWLLYGINITSFTDVVIILEILKSTSEIRDVGLSFYESFIAFLKVVFDSSSSETWKTVILIYLMFSIGSSIKLSKADIVHAAFGFLFIVISLLLINLTTRWTGNYADNISIVISQTLSGFYFIMICNLGISLVFLSILFVLSIVFNSR